MHDTWIANNYGSKKGLLRYYKYNTLRLWGFYTKEAKQPNTFKRLVFVCSGNICRSPFGEAVARSLGLEAISFGFHCRGGDPANPRAIELSKRYNIDLSGHVSANMKDYKPLAGDLLVLMEPSHLNDLKRIQPQAQAIFVGCMTKPKTVYLHDPYNANEAFFIKCLDTIRSSVSKLHGIL